MAATRPIESRAGVITDIEWRLQAFIVVYDTLLGFIFAAVSLVVSFYLMLVIGLAGILLFLVLVFLFAGPYIAACLWVAWALWRKRPWAILAFALICLLNVLYSFFWPHASRLPEKLHYAPTAAPAPPVGAAAAANTFISLAVSLSQVLRKIADVLNVTAVTYLVVRWVHIAWTTVLLRLRMQRGSG